ncbi:MAG: hypothetical protein CW338_10290, partial [Clostridiales bacterium]|nr:hypothetical protein [Clostridiales bacterium]
MLRILLRIVSAVLILMIPFTAITEEEANTMGNEPVLNDGHFVPENPDMENAGNEYVICAPVPAGQEWYADMLKAARVRTGNNRRLKKVATRANAGERITVAAIGGSITEGAGAATYQQCYADLAWKG